jgi:hypothetical protein
MGYTLTASFSVIDKAGLSSARLVTLDSLTSNLVATAESESAVTAFPNPFHESLKLRIQSDSSAQYMIRFYDNAGRLLLQDTFVPTSADDDTHTLDLPKLSSGMHVIVVDGLRRRYRKVIKVWKED